MLATPRIGKQKLASSAHNVVSEVMENFYVDILSFCTNSALI